MTAMKEQPSARQIYGTIGPACADVKTLEAMFRSRDDWHPAESLPCDAGSGGGSGGRPLHKAAQRCGKQAELLIDMQGPGCG
ncbi:MAG: hypothetical protein ACLSHO_07815 [Dysosmobacter sp.]